MYAMNIKDPKQFITQVVGVQGIYTTKDVENYLRSILVSEIASVLGNQLKGKSLLDLAAVQADLGDAIRDKAKDDFEQIGVNLNKVYVETIEPSEEVQKAIGQRSAMGALGTNYMEYQAGQAMREAAQNPSGGGAASIGAGLGAGVGIGQAMAQNISQGMNAPKPQAGSGDAPITKAAIQKALLNLDIRLANGDISEATYNKLQENLKKALDAATE
jgi:membrane protease subunit (stomatin/prohibitin family)